MSASKSVNLVPKTIKLVDYYGDGENARHFLFRFSDDGTGHKNPWTGVRPGEFFTLCVPGAGEAPFTFTYPPNRFGEFCALVRCMGRVSRALFELGVGACLGARGPFGRPWPLQELRGERVLIVAGGCGLAPLVMLIDELLTQNCCEKLALVYGARTHARQVLTSERERWQKQMQVFDVLETPGAEAAAAKEDMPPYADKNIIPQYPLSDMKNTFFGIPLDIMPALQDAFGEPTRLLLCGPEAMMQAIAQYFVARKLPATAIWLAMERRMSSAVGLCGQCADGPIFRWDEVLGLDGDRT